MSSKQPLLAFDTCLNGCSVALWKDDKIITSRAINERNQQAKALIPLIAKVMQESGVEFHELSSIATTIGPGSFTGVRLGLAVARAFALAHNINLYTVSSLQLLAWQAAKQHYNEYNEESLIVSAIDAYRNQLYLQVFKNDSSTTPMMEAFACNSDDLTKHLTEKTYITAGNGTEILENRLPNKTFIQSRGTMNLDARVLAEYTAIAVAPPTIAIEATPLYLRDADAKPQTKFLF